MVKETGSVVRKQIKQVRFTNVVTEDDIGKRIIVSTVANLTRFGE